MAAGIGELDTVPELEFINIRPRTRT
jgi:hypothetical protein